jgi:hypothetical protein
VNTELLIAILGFAGSIIAALIGLLGNQVPKPAPASPEPLRTSTDWGFVLQWVVACSIVEAVFLSLGDDWVGVSVPITQSVVLSRRVRWAWWWFMASTAAWFTTFWLAWNVGGSFSKFTLYIPLLGLLFGFFQWTIIRDRLVHSARWLISSPASWAIASLVGESLMRLMGNTGYAVGFAVGGVLSGITLDYMFRYPERGSPAPKTPLQPTGAKRRRRAGGARS